MKHKISVVELEKEVGPQASHMAAAIEACVHCGFCLPACPTYQVLGQEMDSPRGRIVIMKSILEGELDLDEALPYIDRCLGCLGCVSVCPSGVQYNELVLPFRAYAQNRREESFSQGVQEFLIHTTLPHPGRFRLAANLGRAAQPLAGVLPKAVRSLLEMVPEELPPGLPLPEFVPAEGKVRARVALLAGCVQQVLAPEINWATVRVLARNGVEVVIPKGQECCGALFTHTGHQESARQLARKNLAAFPPDVDAVLTNAAGCGSGLHEYPLLFEGLPEEEQARDLSNRAMDVSVFLIELGLLPPPENSRLWSIAYHDACHLAHAQGIRSEPRRLLESVPNLTLIELPEGEICCGSAGTYNLQQPEIAAALGRRKAEAVVGAGCDAVAMGNIGCMIQIRNHLHELGVQTPVMHTMEILDQAYRSPAE